MGVPILTNSVNPYSNSFGSQNGLAGTQQQSQLGALQGLANQNVKSKISLFDIQAEMRRQQFRKELEELLKEK
jgi:hypothetical protein